MVARYGSQELKHEARRLREGSRSLREHGLAVLERAGDWRRMAADRLDAATSAGPAVR